MPIYIDTPKHKYSFTLIRIAEASYKLFLRSNDPEVKMLGILANFGKEDSYSAVKSIVDGMRSFTKSDFAKSRHIDKCLYLYSYEKMLNKNLKELCNQ
jgi:hypothetical protein